MKPQKTSALLAAALWPPSVLYGGFVRLRSLLYDRGWAKQQRLSGTVISVGNISVGGTGKTPMVMWLAQKFVAQGKRVAILSRGYRGSRGTSDEIELMRQKLGTSVAFGVGKDRVAEGQRLGSRGVDIFLVDDGFQHRRLGRDVDIVLVDGSRPNERRILPSGRLREPLSSLGRADIVVCTRTEGTVANSLREIHGHSAALPVFRAETRLLGFRRLGEDAPLRAVQELGQGPFFAFCGIGNPDAFFRDLHRWGVPLAGTMRFRDHHRYGRWDIERLARAARDSAAFIATEKDAQNLSSVSFGETPVYVCAIDLQIAQEDEFLAAIRRIAEAKRRAA